MARPQVRITSDGTPAGTHVYNSDGVEIKGVNSAWISFDSEDLAAMQIEVTFPIADVTSEDIEVVVECPVCSEKVSHHCEGRPALGVVRMNGAQE